LAHRFGFAAAIARTNDVAVRCENQFLTPVTVENRSATAEDIRLPGANRLAGAVTLRSDSFLCYRFVTKTL
jgi:hypothetical protein